MLSTLNRHLNGAQASVVADWAVVMLGAVGLMLILAGTLIAPAQDIQSHIDTESARSRAAL